MKKFLAVLIATVMALSVFGAALMASAAEEEYWNPVIEEPKRPETVLEALMMLFKAILSWISDGSNFLFFGNTSYK